MANVHRVNLDIAAVTWVRRPFLAGILVSVIVLAFMLPAAARARDLVIAGVEEAPLKMYFNHDYYGIDIDVVKEAMQRMGVTYRITLLDVGARMMRLAELGQVDMVLAVSRKPEREKYLLYSQQSYLELTWHFFIRTEDVGQLAYNDFGDFVGHRIGATNGYAYTDAFWQAKLDLLRVNSNEQQIPLLLAKRIDAAPMNTLVTRYELKLAGVSQKITYLPKPLTKAAYYNAFARKSEYPQIEQIVTRYDQAIEEMLNDGTIESIYQRYLD